MKRLPGFLGKYFWDVEFKKMDFDDHKLYILKRILEYGDREAVAWMWKNFKKEEIKNALCNFRGYSLKTANFWAFILKINKESVKCLNKSFLEIQKQFWPY
jgi:hypothetical protein